MKKWDSRVVVLFSYAVRFRYRRSFAWAENLHGHIAYSGERRNDRNNYFRQQNDIKRNTTRTP